MNSLIRSRLGGIAAVLLLPMVLCGFTPVNPALVVCGGYTLICVSACYLLFWWNPPTYDGCVFGYCLATFMVCYIFSMVFFLCLMDPAECRARCMDEPCAIWFEQFPLAAIESCEEYPDQCGTTFEQMKLAAIEYCETNPAECQEAFDSWVESFEEEAGE